MVYRREIDGLRAIAVLAVMLYHAGIGGSGFVGVDVFFVISGYLITGLLADEHQATGRIDLPAFYARRARRLLPAAVACVVPTLAAGFMLLSPGDFSRLANSAGASSVFGANFFFQSVTGGYFDPGSEEMPLLHLWSLSVEEQFYLLWPAVLIALLRWRARPWPLLLGLAIASFALAESWMRTNPEAAFFQMPARFWELAAGGLVAVSPRNWPRWLAPVGIAATLAACVIPAGHFPGTGALPAVLGACAVLGAVHGGAANRFLAAAPMVGVGLVSYSLYLWHWPLLALYRATSIGEGSTSVRLQLCAVALLLAAASYRYIEQPIRRMRAPSKRTILAGAGVSLSIALGAIAWGNAARQSVQPTAAQIAAAAAQRDQLPLACHAWAGDAPVAKCRRSAKATVGIWGDSMAWSWTPAALAIDPEAARFTRDACGPYLGYLPPDALPGEKACFEFTAGVPAQVHGLQTLVLAARWQDDPARFRALRASLRAVSSHVGRVVIIGPSPELRDRVPRCIERGDPGACAIPRAEFEVRAKPIRDAIRQAAAGLANVELVDPAIVLCTASECPGVDRGVALYWDSHHLTTTAAKRLALSRISASRSSADFVAGEKRKAPVVQPGLRDAGGRGRN
jgi:peptidoglycan/LPS O-acetylase OafA/YrhL